MEKPSLARPLILVFFVIGISLLHYLTPLQLPYMHDIFQHLYYLPIILVALWFGLRGGFLSSRLGAAITRKIIKSHGGSLLGKSTEGSGTAVTAG